MNHQEMIKELSERLGKTQKETRQLLDSIIKIMTVTFDEGKGISIPGLGTFQPHKTNPRKMFNPTDDKNYMIPPKSAIRFSCSTSLKSSLPTNPVENE
jgi:DNA-binding protein HU-beta